MNLKTILLVAVATNFAGCTTDIRDQSATEIQQQINVATDPSSAAVSLTAPDLKIQHFRVTFYGYNTVSYHLSATKNAQTSSDATFLVQFDADYGAVGAAQVRHYEMAKIGNSLTIPTTNLKHNQVKCQVYGDMVNGCLFRDRADVPITLEALQASRQSGLTITLSSTDKNYESLDLPAQYVDGFLKAVLNQ